VEIALRVFREKSADANPYYPSSEGIYNCVRTVRELIENAGANVITITRIAGGHRSDIQNDAEVDISILLCEKINQTEYISSVEDICKKYDVKWLEIREK